MWVDCEGCGPHYRRKKEKKNYARTRYRHECEPVVRMLNTADRVVTWEFMPLISNDSYMYCITLFEIITMSCETDNIPWNVSSFSLNVKNILYTYVSPT